MPHGQLATGAYGEGYYDRRHPHTYVHELMLTGADVLGRLAREGDEAAEPRRNSSIAQPTVARRQGLEQRCSADGNTIEPEVTPLVWVPVSTRSDARSQCMR